MITIRRAVRAVLQCAGLSRRTPEITVSMPTSTGGEISVPIDDDAFTLEDDLGPVVGAAPDASADLPASTIPVPRPVCLPSEPGSMQWWRSHQWLLFDGEFICARCERVWPEPQQDREYA